MFGFLCNHPFRSLAVEKNQTVDTMSDPDFDLVTLHLHCTKCGKNLQRRYATCKGGVEEFLKRKNINEH